MDKSIRVFDKNVIFLVFYTFGMRVPKFLGWILITKKCGAKEQIKKDHVFHVLGLLSSVAQFSLVILWFELMAL